MNIHTLLAKQLPIINDSIHRINYGGCGLFALELHKLLDEYNIKASIHLVDYNVTRKMVEHMIERLGGDDINSAYKILIDTNSHASPCLGHVCLQVDGTLYDSNGMSRRPAVSDAIEPEVMQRLVRHPNTWNRTFLACNGNPHIEDMSLTLQSNLTMLLRGLSYE